MDDYLNDLLRTRGNIEKKGDRYVITCPFDGEEFEAENLLDAIHKEGVYRSKNFIEHGEIPDESDLNTASKVLEKWSKENTAQKDSKVRSIERIMRKTAENKSLFAKADAGGGN